MPKISAEEKIIHDQFVQYGRNSKEWMRKCILLLPHIEKHKIWEKKGFNSIYEYAGKLAGMSRYKVNESLRILKKVEDKPELMKVVERRGIFAVKPVVTLATQQTAKFWADKASIMTKNTLETFVKEFKKEQVNFENLDGLLKPNEGDFGRPRTSQEIAVEDIFEDINAEKNSPKKVQTEIFETNSIAEQTYITMQLDPEVAQELSKLKGQGGSWNGLIKHLLQIRKKQLDTQKPEPVGTDSRHIPNKIQRFVKERHNGQCAFPDCIKPAKIFQHTQRWALENVHDSDRLYWLCKEHERLAHLGLIENEEQSPRNWKIRMQPDKNDPKYGIDLIVQTFRNQHW